MERTIGPPSLTFHIYLAGSGCRLVFSIARKKRKKGGKRRRKERRNQKGERNKENKKKQTITNKQKIFFLIDATLRVQSAR